jgi:hypothetical protein
MIKTLSESIRDSIDIIKIISEEIIDEYKSEKINITDILNKIESNPKFKSFFQGSKVVDKNGHPLVLYHGNQTIGNIKVL